MRILLEYRVGHGYPPVWSPDGETVAFVRRENVESQLANHVATALHSNIYLADIAAAKVADNLADNGAIVSYEPTPFPTEPAPTVVATKVTSFTATQVYDIAWSPDGTQLAFTAGDAVWLVVPGQEEAWQVSTPGVPARHPAWIATGSE